MTESHAWSTARGHLAPYLLMTRIENRLGEGTPDWHYISRWGVSGWVEMKEDLSCLTREQVLFAEEYVRYGGRCHLLWRHPTGWALFDSRGTRTIFEDRKAAKEAALVWMNKEFPLRAILSFLAPRYPLETRTSRSGPIAT